MNQAKALEALKAVVGDRWFFDKEDEIKKRAHVSIPSSKAPLAFIYPGNADEIKQILAIANEHTLPLWPCSRGKNWGYGSATAVRDDTVVVMLDRLNKIIHVDPELAYAVVEPGVTYRQIHQYLRDHNINLICDSIDGTPDASVLGNALERGHGGTNYGDHFANLCGIEAILANGETIQTGGGPKDCHTLHTYKWGVGPYTEGLFSQGNFGIVTKIGMWLMPIKPKCVSVLLEIANNEMLGEAINKFRTLQLDGIIESKLMIGNDYFSFSLSIDYPHHLCEEGYLGDTGLASLREQYKVSCWSASAAIYGDKDEIRYKQKRIKRELSAVGKLMFVGDGTTRFIENMLEESKKPTPENKLLALCGRLAEKATHKPLRFFEPLIAIHNHHKGIPCDFFVENALFGDPACYVEIDQKNELNLAANDKGKMWFAPLVPMNSHHVLHVLNGCKALFQEHKFDFGAGLLLFNPRTAIAISRISFNKKDPEHAKRAMALFRALHKWCIQEGYQVYRTNVAHMEEVIDCSPTFKEFLNLLRHGVDPSNIIAPGKYGVG